MHLSMSPIYYAQKTGKPIVCMTYSVKRCAIIEKAWDKMMVPFPFNKGICLFSKPVYIPPTANNDELEKYRQEVEKMLNRLNYNADKKMGITPIKPGTEAKLKSNQKKQKGL
jgi:lysophospholipid acyltransferase (LPLAT)-like uncharacterized protein